jgi:hypothetical protein
LWYGMKARGSFLPSDRKGHRASGLAERPARRGTHGARAMTGADGKILEVTLRPDNKALKPIVVVPEKNEVRVVVEYLETVG